jgi:hypothetical protein
MTQRPTRAHAHSIVPTRLLLVLIAACSDSRRSDPVSLTHGVQTVTWQDSINRGLVRARPDAAAAVGVEVGSAAASIVSLTPSNRIGFDQPSTIVGIPSGPLWKVVVTGSGAVECSGNYGTLIGYDATGAVVGTAPLSEIDVSDCSPPERPDNVTYGLTATLIVTPGTIVKFEISPFSPLSGPVLEPDNGTYVPGNFYQNYDIVIGGVVPRISVICTPATITRAAAVSCVASATGGTLAITGWTFTATDPLVGNVTVSRTSATWAGPAVASGAVTVDGKVGGASAESDTGRITVTARPGWTWSAAKSTGDATPGTLECRSDRHYATGNYGWATADSSCKNMGLLIWPDPEGKSSKRGYTIGAVPSGPNAGLWYVTNDKTGMHIRAQVHKDIRPDGFSYSVSGKDTVAKRCKSAGLSGNRTVTEVNITCMTDPNPLNFAALYAFAWRHEECHLLQARNVFPTIADVRLAIEPIVRPDTTAIHFAAMNVNGGFNDANDAVHAANTIDGVPNPQSFTFWSRNSANSSWFLRTYSPMAILAPGC